MRNLFFFFLGLSLIALLLRLSFFYFLSRDAPLILMWYNFIKENDVKAFAHDFSNYPPAFLYLIFLVTKLPLSPLAGIKVISVLFDFLAAIVMSILVSLHYRQLWLQLAGFLAVLFMPTIIVNGSFWGQSDIIYSFFLLLAAYMIIREHSAFALASFGAALAFKPQAIFLLPALFYLLLINKLKWRDIWLLPASYIITIIPAWLAGRSFYDLITIYLHQGYKDQSFTMSAANIYVFLGDRYSYPYIPPFSIMVALGVLSALVALAFVMVCYKKIKRPDTSAILLITVISLALMPFLLPAVHDRYFFPAELLSIALAFYNPRLWPVPVAFQLSGLLSYARFLFGGYFYGFTTYSLLLAGSFINLAVISFLLFYLQRNYLRAAER